VGSAIGALLAFVLPLGPGVSHQDLAQRKQILVRQFLQLGELLLGLDRPPAGSGQLSRDTLAVLAWQQLACHPLDRVDLEPRPRHVRRIGWDGASAIDDLGGPRVRLRLARAGVLSRKPLMKAAGVVGKPTITLIATAAELALDAGIAPRVGRLEPREKPAEANADAWARYQQALNALQKGSVSPTKGKPTR
jgi:hypothetical protein